MSWKVLVMIVACTGSIWIPRCALSFCTLPCSEGFSPVVRKFVTSQTFWEGTVNMAGPPVDIDPESIKWLQV